MASTCFAAPAPVTRRVRVYFAPVNRPAQAPVLFDPAQQGGFNLDAPPAPWIGLGWIQNFVRKPASQSATVLTGIPAAPLEQVRQSVEAQLSFEFLSWTKLTMALATGSQHMNLLAPPAAVIPQPGSTATSIVLTATDAAKFQVGSIVAIDADYTGQTGFVGAPVAGAYLRQRLADRDYIRRVTFNVAVVAQADSTGLVLASPLPGGAPAAGAKAQALIGFADREGGSFYPEWSALFAMEGSQGERMFFHYPRLQPVSGAEEVLLPLDARNKTGQSRVLLKARFLALPVTDALDGERVVCYRSFLPAAKALV